MMKKIISIVCVVALCFLAISCTKNDGRQNPKDFENKIVVSLQFVNTDYMGGIQYQQLIDLTTLTYSTRVKIETETEWEIQKTFTQEEADEYLKNLKECNIFGLYKKYEPKELILDGGGWDLIITFDDGTFYMSQGSNATPTEANAINSVTQNFIQTNLF